MELIVQTKGMSDTQITRITAALELMEVFFEGSDITSITASAPNELEEDLAFQKGEQRLVLRCKGDRFAGGFLLVDNLKEEEVRASRVRFV